MWRYRSLIYLSPERLSQYPTNTEVDDSGQTLDWPQGPQWRSERKDPRSWRSYQPLRRNNIMNQPLPQEFPGTKLPHKSKHGRSHGSSCICSRGWPWTLKGGEVLVPEKAQCPRIGNTRTGKEKWVSWPAGARGDRIGCFHRVKQKGDSIWNVNKENIQPGSGGYTEKPCLKQQ